MKLGSSAFWDDFFRLHNTATETVLKRGLWFGAFALAVGAVEVASHTSIAIPIAPFEVAGAALSLLLVLRTNAGYDRWWEGRKLWGGIVNQCRNLTITALAYGPPEPEWRWAVAGWTAAFAHAARRSLRGERELPELAELLGDAEAARIAAADHMPGYVSSRIAALLRQAADAGQLDRFGFLQADRERATLIDHLGGCERIAKSPLPKAYGIEIRRFLIIFLLVLPFELVDKFDESLAIFVTPILTMLIAYPILALDEIGSQLQQPFSSTSLNHLTLDELCATIERNVLALAEGDAKPQP